MVSFVPHVASSSYPSSIVLKNIEGLASSILTDLVITFQMDFLEQADPGADASTLQFSIVEGPVREGILEPEVVATPGLNSTPVVEVD